MINNPLVVAVAGPSGSGKSELVRGLANHFDCPFLFFDQFADASTYPKDMHEWLIAGCPLEELSVPGFESAIESLKCEHQGLIFIEEPFGRLRPSMAKLVDFVLLLDIPLEICLSRVILRNHRISQVDNWQAVKVYLEQYQSHLADIYKLTTEQVRYSAEATITGNQCIENVQTQAISLIQALLNDKGQ